MSALTQGRLARFQAPGSNVVAVQFVAILDARVTDICRSRDGLILRLDDLRLGSNTPPLHYMCRSTLRAIDDWDWEDLQNGDEATLKRLFGYLRGDGSPKDLESALDGWGDVPAPLKGFGEVGAPKVKPASATPKASGDKGSSPKKSGSGGGAGSGEKPPSPPGSGGGTPPEDRGVGEGAKCSLQGEVQFLDWTERSVLCERKTFSRGLGTCEG